MFSTLTNQIRSSAQRSSRNGAKIDHVILHHSAALNADVVLDMMVSGSREVSSNYVIGNDGTIYGVVDEEDRAFTSGSGSDGGKGAAWDRRSITFEVLDADTNWNISEAAYASIAKMLADISRRYGFPLKRDGKNSTVFGHKELWEFFEASYPTACPGKMDVDHTVALALGSITPHTAILEDDDMIKIYSPNRQSALVGPGYVYPLDTDEKAEHAASLATKVLAGNDRQYDLWLAMATQGRSTAAGTVVDYEKLAAAIRAQGGAAPTAEQIAKAVNDDAAARLKA